MEKLRLYLPDADLPDNPVTKNLDPNIQYSVVAGCSIRRVTDLRLKVISTRIFDSQTSSIAVGKTKRSIRLFYQATATAFLYGANRLMLYPPPPHPATS